MQEYIYEETKYIKRVDHKDFVQLMLSCEFMPEEIQDDVKFNILFQYLGNLTIKAPDFLPPYEYTIRMIAELEPDKELEWLQKDLEQRWFDACERIAQKEGIFNKTVEWAYMENRPLIRGLYFGAESLWKNGQLELANEHFKKILKTNPDDNIGARYAVKATAERMSYEVFSEKFTFEDTYGTFYNNELSKWYGE
jgi:tetratricopeptide (TPR) repeat protein